MVGRYETAQSGADGCSYDGTVEVGGRHIALGFRLIHPGGSLGSRKQTRPVATVKAWGKTSHPSLAD